MLRDRLKNFGIKVRKKSKDFSTGVDKIIDKYNEKVEKIKEPEVKVGLEQNTMMYLVGVVILIWMFFKRK